MKAVVIRGRPAGRKSYHDGKKECGSARTFCPKDPESPRKDQLLSKWYSEVESTNPQQDPQRPGIWSLKFGYVINFDQ